MKSSSPDTPLQEICFVAALVNRYVAEFVYASDNLTALEFNKPLFSSYWWACVQAGLSTSVTLTEGPLPSVLLLNGGGAVLSDDSDILRVTATLMSKPNGQEESLRADAQAGLSVSPSLSLSFVSSEHTDLL